MSDAGRKIVEGLANDLSGRTAVENVKNKVSDVVGQAKKYYQSSPLHTLLSGSQPETTYKYDQNAVAPKAAPAKPVKKMPSYEKGTDRVPKTGPAMLHKDEAVLTKDEAAKHRVMKGAGEELSGDKKPEKEISHIITKKAKKDGKTVHVHTHVHTHPMHHPNEEHVTEGNDGLADHLMEHMGEPNPGEAEADAGQSGVPEGQPQAAPQAAPQTAPQGAPMGGM
jgi:hypothetical protein